MKRLYILFFVLIAMQAKGQQLDTIKVMSYNLLNFPSVSAHRIDTLKRILAYVKPDILMVCELTSGPGADAILFDALNEDGESAYDMADYITGPDTQNELYFNSDKLGLIEQNVIPTTLRDINEYVLYYKSTDIETTTDTVFFYIYVCHLKASSGFEADRNVEVTALKTYLNSRPQAENILVGGDFNFYGSEIEPAWNTLLNGGGVILKDPLTLPGNWHADPGFAWAHTQSTRTSEFDGGAFGGLDDRFDFIFVGEDLKNYSNDALYILNSYRAIGQDGFHFNKSLIEAPANVSEPPLIISALHSMSDHLPVYLEIEVVKEAAEISEQSQPNFEAYFDAGNNEIVFLNGDSAQLSKAVFQIYSTNGQLVKTVNSISPQNRLALSDLPSGSYILKMVDLTYQFKFVKP